MDGTAIVPDEIRVAVRTDSDIVVARQEGRTLAQPLGFSNTDLTLIATAISEIARNVLTYAGHGEIVMSVLEDGHRRGILVVTRDEGPGIEDLLLALEDGYSTSGGLGLGLSGSKRLMDDFEVVSDKGSGTTVTMTKWAP